MASRTIYTRTYSNSSAGRLVSGKAPEGDTLSDTALLEQFSKHADRRNREPTALVSGSRRIVDSLARAFDKHYSDDESPADIWIAFIEVPPTRNEDVTRIHSAKTLAEKCEHPEPNKFSHEVVFEWAIPEEWVVHKVSLQTLTNRGLQARLFQHPSAEARGYTARELQQQDPWEIGVTLGLFARKFGARAPVNWISHQLFHDCVRAKILYDDMVRLKYAHGHFEIVDSQFFFELDDGIDTSLCDWWFLDDDFLLDCEDFGEWRDMTEDRMTWDLNEFWETWHKVDYDGTIKELSAEETLLYDKAKNKLLVEHERKRAAIEAKAVEIGL